MNKLLIALVIVLALGLVGAVVFGLGINHDKNALTAELLSVKTELASTKKEFTSTKDSLLFAQAELGYTNNTLSSTQSELTSTKNILNATRTELSTTNQTLTSKLVELNSANDKYSTAQKSLTTAQDSLSSTQKKLAAAQDTLSGLGIIVASSPECFDVQLVDNANAKNPTWQQLKDFLATDKTENHDYILNVYDCSQFSRDLHNRAEAAGIRAAEVQIYFSNDNVGHALDAFITPDYGLVYIDCTGAPDKINYVKRFKVLKAVDVRWMTDPKNARSDSWWASQSQYYYVGANDGTQGVTSQIKFFW
jgi:hypothetical protein